MACKSRKEDGSPCLAPPLKDGDHCRLHAPDDTGEVAEARRLGGLRRRRERTVSEAYDFEGLGSIHHIRRLLEIAVLDTLGLENGIPRSRTLAALAVVSIKALEVADFDDRVKALEAAIAPRQTGRRR